MASKAASPFVLDVDGSAKVFCERRWAMTAASCARPPSHARRKSALGSARLNRLLRSHPISSRRHSSLASTESCPATGLEELPLLMVAGGNKRLLCASTWAPGASDGVETNEKGAAGRASKKTGLKWRKAMEGPEDR